MSRRTAAVAVATAVAAIARLDALVHDYALYPAWALAEQQVAGVAAALGQGIDADFEHVFRARLGASLLPRGHVQLGDLDDHSGLPLLIADARAAPAQAPDLADLTLALPFALRRAKLSRVLLPAVTGSPRLLAIADALALEGLERWALALAEQAGQGAARLRVLERYATHVETTLAGIARPAALRRLVGIALGTWTVWAAQLARLTGVHVSTAVRTLEQAAALGLVAQVPLQSRSRGDGTAYAVPPWLRHAGLILVRLGRPANVRFERVGRTPEQGAIGEFEAAMAALDALQGS